MERTDEAKIPAADGPRDPRQAEFERALLEALTLDHDLDVRLASDQLERRRNGVATLSFRYQYHATRPDKAKVVVSIHGVSDRSFVFHPDLASFEAMAHSASDCETLAAAVREFNEDWRLRATTIAGELGVLPQRRADD